MPSTLPPLALLTAPLLALVDPRLEQLPELPRLGVPSSPLL
jgi:hypothetical protein